MTRVVCLAAILAAQTSEPASQWVSFDAKHRLQYKTDDRGNRIMDFSHAGYRGGGVRIPDVRVAVTLKPVEGDNGAQIQEAIDKVSQSSLDRDGLRGAVKLEAGTYEIEKTLTIAASGVVLRGSAGAVIKMTGRPHRFLAIRGAGTWQTSGNAAAITDEYVPSGADSFHLRNASEFRAGDLVLILDVPMSDSLDAQFLKPDGATVVHYTFPGRIANVGVENLKIVAPSLDVPISEGQYTLLTMDAVLDSWARDIAVEETQNAISIGGAAKRVTLDNIRIVHKTSHTGAAAPADFSISGTQILVNKCSVNGEGTWPLVTQANVTGPNVVLHMTTDERGVSPHQRWATGLLVDSSTFANSTERWQGIAFSNRKTAGSGHGWDVGWAVAWNVTAPFFLVQQPPGAINWCIGCVGEIVDSLPLGTFESRGTPVTPASLYLAQLRERLGDAALANIGYR